MFCFLWMAAGGFWSAFLRHGIVLQPLPPPHLFSPSLQVQQDGSGLDSEIRHVICLLLFSHVATPPSHPPVTAICSPFLPVPSFDFYRLSVWVFSAFRVKGWDSEPSTCQLRNQEAERTHCSCRWDRFLKKEEEEGFLVSFVFRPLEPLVHPSSNTVVLFLHWNTNRAPRGWSIN